MRPFKVGDSARVLQPAPLGGMTLVRVRLVAHRSGGLIVLADGTAWLQPPNGPARGFDGTDLTEWRLEMQP